MRSQAFAVEVAIFITLQRETSSSTESLWTSDARSRVAKGAQRPQWVESGRFPSTTPAAADASPNQAARGSLFRFRIRRLIQFAFADHRAFLRRKFASSVD